MSNSLHRSAPWFQQQQGRIYSAARGHGIFLICWPPALPPLRLLSRWLRVNMFVRKYPPLWRPRWGTFPYSRGPTWFHRDVFSSELKSPFGSLVEGILARDSDLQTRSFICAWRDCRPALDLHDMPCVPRESTYEPHGQVWGSQMSAPSLSPTATLIVSSSSLSPQVEMGSAWSQSLLCGALTASSLALSRSSLQLSNKMPTALSIAALSQVPCLWAESLLGSSAP